MAGALVFLLVVIPVVALGVLTYVGSRRRGDSSDLAVLSAFVFPATWIAWYVQDELRTRTGGPPDP
jgi:hypothetical protein